MTSSTSPKDWTEDFHLENGCYNSLCIICQGMFIGYKRRHVCKTCDEECKQRAQELARKKGVTP